jgi:hypothetical protein
MASRKATGYWDSQPEALAFEVQPLARDAEGAGGGVEVAVMVAEREADRATRDRAGGRRARPSGGRRNSFPRRLTVAHDTTVSLGVVQELRRREQRQPIRLCEGATRRSIANRDSPAVYGHQGLWRF